MATLDEIRAEAAETPPAEWDVFLILPNLNPRTPSQFTSPYLCICSGNDPLMHSVIDSAANQASLSMLHRYTSWFGTPYMPGCLLVHRDAPPNARNGETLRGFRNLSALSSMTRAVASVLTGGQWKPTYTDFFVFAAHVATKTGEVGKLDGAVGGMNHEIEKFRGLCSGQIELPGAFGVDVDEILFTRLVKAWEAYYLRESPDRTLLPLFRSLEVAFQAGQFPSDGLTSIHDAGTRIGLWVSAFEVLCHPGADGKVNKRVVQELLNTVLPDDPQFAQTYELNYNGPYKVSLLGQIYEELYAARNAFMHGEPVRGQQLRFDKNPKRPHLFALAAIVYNLALRAFTNAKFPLTEDEESDDYYFGIFSIITKALKHALVDDEDYDE